MITEKLIIEIAGITIMEPMATFTDLWVTIAGFTSFYLLSKRKELKGRMYTMFKWHFLIMAIATLLGGLLGHAFFYAVNVYWKLPGWIISMISVSLMERAFIAHAVQQVSQKTRTLFKWANNIELLIFIGITIYTLDFRFVEVHSAFGFTFVALPLQIFMYLKTKDPGTKYFFIAVAVGLVDAVIFTFRISVHQWFNYLALAHLLMTIIVIFLYKTAITLRYNPEPETAA